MDPPPNVSSLPLKVQLFFAIMGTPSKPGTLVHYDAATGDLVAYLWPVNYRQDRIPPALFPYYRSKHHFRNPNCFCPLRTGDLINKETSVFMPTEGPFKYRYIAACASDECPYVAPLFFFHHLSDASIRYYPRRIEGDPGPAPVLHISEIRRSLGAFGEYTGWDAVKDEDAKSDTATEISDPSSSNEQAIPIAATVWGPIHFHRRPFHLRGANIITWDMPPHQPRSFYAMTLTMDAVIRPGVLVDDFLSTVCLCSCGILTSIRAFSAHQCQVIAKSLELGANPTSEILRKLDCIVDPGVPVEQFLAIVVKCPCGIITTRRAFLAHGCYRILLKIW